MTKRKPRPSDILRKAAEYLNKEIDESKSRNRNGCCYAVAVAGGHLRASEKVRAEARLYLESLFKKGGKLYWFGDTFYRPEQEHRVMSLLLTAAIAESVGR